tara:strand:- start:1481 stop:1666 length:186 start_codon:yes stop_codon:yes gene_type:complete
MVILKNYEDKYTEAHRRLKDMYKYNYNTDFNDETDLKTPLRKHKNVEEILRELYMEEERNA